MLKASSGFFKGCFRGKCRAVYIFPRGNVKGFLRLFLRLKMLGLLEGKM